MKAGLERAQEALASGRTGEASFYAWNALANIGPGDASELAGIARELGDSRLLDEIARRGFSTVPSQVEKSRRVKRGPLRRFLRAVPILVFALIGVLFIIAINKAEPANRYPTAKDVASEYKFTRPLLTEASGVWLVPLGEPRRVDLKRLADELVVRYRVPVAVLPDIALPRWTLDA